MCTSICLGCSRERAAVRWVIKTGAPSVLETSGNPSQVSEAAMLAIGSHRLLRRRLSLWIALFGVETKNVRKKGHGGCA